MAIITWRARKKLFFFSIVFAVAVIIIGLIVFSYWPKATCFDGRKNQGEEEADCGGPCTPCVVNPQDVITIWSRVLEIGENVYEAAALIENPNLFYGLPSFNYIFKLYDYSDTLVSLKEGQTFLNPQDRYVIFTTGIEIDKRKPTKAILEIEPLEVLNWQYLEKEKTSLLVSSKTFQNFPFPTLRASLSNKSLFVLKDIEAIGVLYDERGNVMAVSSTKLDLISAESSRNIVFTWPAPFEQEPVSSEIFTRVNLFEKND